MISAIRSIASSESRHSVLYRLHRDGKLTHARWQAGTRLRDDEMDSRDTSVSDLLRDVRGNGGYPDARLARQAKALGCYSRAQEALLEAGVVVFQVTLNVCIGDFEPRELARRALGPIEGLVETELATALNLKTKAVLAALGMGLDALSKHYGAR